MSIKIINPDGVSKKIQIVDENENIYTKIRNLGGGGQAKVWIVRRDKDKKDFAFKFYKGDNANTTTRQNIQKLIVDGPIVDQNGIEEKGIVMPRAFVSGDDGNYGYIMDLVDLNGFCTLKDIWIDTKQYPSADILCDIICNIATLFGKMHKWRGYCYKDINEGNIFFNPKTGDVRIIDNDNLGSSEIFTIKGTFGYIAPEVLLNLQKPDSRTDQYSLAVYFYRLMVGGYPFEGKYTRDYCDKKGVVLLGNMSAAQYLFGEYPIFTWDPTNRSNAITDIDDDTLNGQCTLWVNLPEKVKKLFIQTFCNAISPANRAQRTHEDQWVKTFQELKKNIITCPNPSCHAKNLPGSRLCIICDTKLPQKTTDSVKFNVFTLNEANKVDMKSLVLNHTDIVSGSVLHKKMSDNSCMQLLKNKNTGRLGLKNLTNKQWRIVMPDKSEKSCNFNEVVEIQQGMKIVIEYKILQLEVENISQ